MPTSPTRAYVSVHVNRIRTRQRKQSTPAATPSGSNGVPNNGKPLCLFPFHLAELRASGLSDDTIAKAGIYSEHDRRRLAALLNRKRWPAKLGSAIVYPYRDEAGAVVLHRVKPERPLVVGS